MTTLTLTKHHGLGNDFLVVFDPPPTDLPALARRLCDRRRGIGADGLLVGTAADAHRDSEHDHVRMVLYNSDGSRAEISGNGIRCFAQALARRTGSMAPQRILTDAGMRVVELWPGAHAREIDAAVDMGALSQIDPPARWADLGVDPLRPVRHVGLGNPHSVVCVDDVDGLDLLALGSVVPEVNLEVVQAGPETQAITMRVHERGAGLTEACGSGACASAAAAAGWGLVRADAEIVVHMPGGDARVRLDHPNAGRVTLLGPAEYVGTVLVDIE